MMKKKEDISLLQLCSAGASHGVGMRCRGEHLLQRRLPNFAKRGAFYLWCGIGNLKIKGVNILFYIKIIYYFKCSSML